MKHGIQAGMVILHLMRLVGERVARYMLLTGELVTADQAKALGLINKVVTAGELMDTALAWADAIAMNAPKAEATTKSLMCKFSGQAIAMSMTAVYCGPAYHRRNTFGTRVILRQETGALVAQAVMISDRGRSLPARGR